MLKGQTIEQSNLIKDKDQFADALDIVSRLNYIVPFLQKKVSNVQSKIGKINLFIENTISHGKTHNGYGY